MTHLDKGKFAKKHGPDRQPDPAITGALKSKIQEGEVSCSAAFEVVAERRARSAEVGLAIDCLEIPIVKCQLGLFGYGALQRIVKPAEEVSPAMEERIRSGLVDGRLPCSTVWEIAAALDLPKMSVSSACELLGIKVSSCQLGAF